MKRFWNKVNRGVVLAVALILLLIGFAVVKEVQFRTEAPLIRDTAKTAIEELLLLNVSDEETVLGRVRSSDVQLRERDRLEAVLSEYWDADAESDYFMDAVSVRASFEKYLQAPVRMQARELTLSIADQDVSVRQNGTDYAVVTVEINALSARYRGDGEMLFYGEYYGGEEIGVVLGEYLGAYDGYVEMELHRRDGVWRVCGMSAWVQLRDKAVIAETGGAD